MWEIATFGLDCVGFAFVTLVAIQALLRVLGAPRRPEHRVKP